LRFETDRWASGVTRLRLSWREILGLLIALAISYGVISYALTNAQNREVASEQTEPRSRKSEIEQPAPAPPPTTPSPASPDGDTRTLTILVTGYMGTSFSGECCTRASSRSVSGNVPTEIILPEADDASLSANPISATIRKTTNDNNVLRVQVLDGREVVESQSTTEPNGTVNLTWSPN
jgi:hypothetical protein